MSDFSKGWESVDEPAARTELAAELSADHVLAGRKLKCVARRVDQDDVLFELDGGGYAAVHLTWSGRREPSRDWPAVETFRSLEDWKTRGMKTG